MEYWKAQVYKDPRWAYLRKAVIKRDRDICYFCGKLITKRRTIHHIIELTPDNYSDPMVAFNLDNLVECHCDCHNQHHDRWGKPTIVNAKLDIDYSKRRVK